MTEQTFRSPNFFDREIDLSAPQIGTPTGTPAGIIATSNRGPAFIPVTVSTFDEYVNTFGNVDPKKFGPYAANEYLKHRQALTFLRVLGAGTNETTQDIMAYESTGRVTNAGFKLEGVAAVDDSRGRHNGAVQFLTARHQVQANEAYGLPMFTDNTSFSGTIVNLVRGMILLASGSRMMVLDGNESSVGKFTAAGPDDFATLVSNKFKLVISSTLGNTFANQDSNPGVRIYTASLDPSSDDYYAKILNTNPDRFVADQHFLYADFPVDAELAAATSVGMLSGTINDSDVSGEPSTTFRAAFGAFNTRYQTPKTPWFISQPFGTTEYDLFQFETIDDGEYANKLYKVSISNITKSPDESNRYGVFNVEIRDWNDSDVNPVILEQYIGCSLDPYSEKYIAKLIGDRKVSYNFDATVETEKRIVASGKYENKSKYVRIKMSDKVERKLVPDVTLPFGFRGPSLLKTTDSLRDSGVTATNARVNGILSGVGLSLSGSIIPPIPLRFKITRGERSNTTNWIGEPNVTELASSQFYWGTRFERVTEVLNPNIVAEKNALIENYTKFLGISKLDTLLTGSGADILNQNKFTLAKVALGSTAITYLTASAGEHMREAAYIRNGALDSSRYTIIDSGFGARITLATLLAEGTALQFNKYSPYAKFTTFFQGGYDGLNFLDRNARRMNDKSTSFETGGGAEASYISPGFLTNQNGIGQSNSNVSSYKTAIKIMTDPMIVNHNILAIPGIRESFLTSFAADVCKDYGLAFYIMDIPSYDDSGNRIYDDSTTQPSITRTITEFDSRVVDNNYSSAYFPDVVLDDTINKRRIAVPASVATLGALAFNDKVRYPWFAPAGFNRASLDFVKNVKVRLNTSDRDALYDSRINPIATFPKQGYVIWGQKTLQINNTTLNRVNVRRMVLEVKRLIVDIARRIVFEQNTVEVRNNFATQATLKLGLIQAQQGIEQFKVVMNESNNTQQDIELNRLNGKIIIVPTRTIETVAMDFIITNSGIQFI